MKFGIREICDVVLKAKANQKVGNKIFYKGEPVIYFDTLKTSSLEGAATTVYAQGGRGNARLMAWEGERTITFTMEDALISPAGFMILSGAGLIEGSEEKPVTVHQVETTDKTEYVTSDNCSLNIVSNGILSNTAIYSGIFIPSKNIPSDNPSSEHFVFILDNNTGEISSEPYIAIPFAKVTYTDNKNEAFIFNDNYLNHSNFFYVEDDEYGNRPINRGEWETIEDVGLIGFKFCWGGLSGDRDYGEEVVEGDRSKGIVIGTEYTDAPKFSLLAKTATPELSNYIKTFETGFLIPLCEDATDITNTQYFYSYHFDYQTRGEDFDHEYFPTVEASTALKNANIVLIDYYTDKTTSGTQQIEITPDKFGGNYYLEASTLFKNTDGVDMPAEFIIPNCKIQSNFTFSMASTGDPSTFTFTMDAFPDYTKFDKTKKVLAAIQITNEANNDSIYRDMTSHNLDHEDYFK